MTATSGSANDWGLALKGAIADFGQLEHRARALQHAGLPIRLELHTFGDRDVDTPEGRRASRQVLSRLRDAFSLASIVLHVPLQDVGVVTAGEFDVEQCRRTIELAHELRIPAIVLHRYWELRLGRQPAGASDRVSAEGAFDDVVRRLAREAGPDLTILVENVGFYWLAPRDRGDFLAGCLEHFFPWEMAAFRRRLRDVPNVEPFVDVAHATLSANLFNLRKAQPERFRHDRRFLGVTEADLAAVEALHPRDFVVPDLRYLHVSDAQLLTLAEARDPQIEPRRVAEAVTAEGLELGSGNLDFEDLLGNLGAGGVIVLEVDPAPGETHVANEAQVRSLGVLASLLRERDVKRSSNRALA